MKPVIFLGPSLPLQEAKTLCDAIYVEPVRQADILKVIRYHNPKVIGIIDGFFYQELSVWHKEILYAMEKGIHVYGSSSMGALRAAELYQFGMKGVGEVYRMFASGELNDDDEVALAHGSKVEDFKGYSEPMVNLRFTFQAAEQAGILTDKEHRELIETTKEIYFPERVFVTIFQAAKERGFKPETLAKLKDFCENHYVDIKKEDAKALLRTIGNLPEDLAPFEPEFRLNQNYLFTGLQEREKKVTCEDLEISSHEMMVHAALHRSDFNEVKFNAMNRHIVLQLAEYFDVQVSDNEFEVQKRSFCLKNKLKTDEEISNWCNDNDLTPEEFEQFIREITICHRMQKWLMAQTNNKFSIRQILDQLRMEGSYQEVKQQTAQFERDSASIPTMDSNFDYHKIGIKELIIRQLRETDFKMDTDFMEWLKTAPFPMLPHFKYGLYRSALLRRSKEAKQKKVLDNLFG